MRPRHQRQLAGGGGTGRLQMFELRARLAGVQQKMSQDPAVLSAIAAGPLTGRKPEAQAPHVSLK